jgi:hypothetical protein
MAWKIESNEYIFYRFFGDRLYPLLLQDLGSRRVVADFGGATLSSGVLLLRQMDANLELTQSLAQRFASPERKTSDWPAGPPGRMVRIQSLNNSLKTRSFSFLSR